MYINEAMVRRHKYCAGCGKEKGIGGLVCWSCFKYRTDIKPLKYSDKSLEAWLKDLPTIFSPANGEPMDFSAPTPPEPTH